MTKARELRSELDARKETERKEAEQRAKESCQAVEQEATKLVPIMFRECIKKCEEENEAGRNQVHLTFDYYAAQRAAPRVADKLRKENFEVSCNFGSYGFRMDGDGYTLSEGTPFVAIDISW